MSRTTTIDGIDNDSRAAVGLGARQYYVMLWSVQSFKHKISEPGAIVVKCDAKPNVVKGLKA